MKKYIAEIVIFCIQLFMFYISPLFAGPTDGMGMVVLAAAFLPSAFLHYNGTAVIHAVWYFVVAAVGMLIGMIIFKVLHRM